MTHSILQLGHATLRKIAEPVIEFNTVELTLLVKQMLETLTGSKGVGLAAPQIGHSVCALIVASKPTARYPTAPLMQPVVMINPHFLHLSETREKDWEGCLSIAGIRALVPRYREIEVAYQDETGGLKTLVLEGFVARVFQHEYDHLQGMVYLDRVENNREIISETEFFKLLAIT